MDIAKWPCQSTTATSLTKHVGSGQTTQQSADTGLTSITVFLNEELFQISFI